MALQVVFAAEHLSAQAARAMPGVSADAGGFLHLCLSDPGAIDAPEDAAGRVKADIGHCVLCVSVANGFAADSVRPAFDARIERAALAVRWRVENATARHSVNHARSARGPPASFQS